LYAAADGQPGRRTCGRENGRTVIAELGLVALWLASALALLQLLVALGFSGEAGRVAVRPLAIVQALLALIAFCALIALFLRSDVSVALVAANSHSAKPWLYKFAGTWGNHEGSMLLWVMVLSLSGGALALFERRVSEPMMIASLGAQAGLALGFYAFLLVASNPFARLDP